MSVREKKEIHQPVDDQPKKKKILTALLQSKRLGEGVLWEPNPSYYNGLFSPLLVQRFRCQKGSSLSVLYEQYETSYLFYITLSFLCNIICYLISVFAFSLVTFPGATTLSCLMFSTSLAAMYFHSILDLTRFYIDKNHFAISCTL